MKRKVLCLLSAFTAVLSVYADGDQASLTSSPSPIVSTKPFEVTIQTSDFGGEVYCYTWAIAGSEEYPASDWAGAINAKFKMTGSGGTYTIKVSDLMSFYGLTEAQLETVTKLGFIARTSSGRQTADCMAEVIQGRKNAYSGGEGTAQSPFILKTTEDIIALSTTSMDWAEDVYFEMGADINVGEFSGIGSKSSPFKGNFDGKGFSLKNASVSNGAIGTSTGVFNAIEGAVITNVGVVDATVSGTTFTGALVGYAASGRVERCFSSGSVTGSSICAGGLIGENVGATVSDCYSTAAVTNTNDYATGGLIGKNKGVVKNTYASGKITAYNYAGGLIGANYGTVSASAAINASIMPTSDGMYIARFGGNNNAANNASNTISWKLMPLTGTDWSAYGHHADDHNANLVSKQTYSDLLGWNFADVWEWRTEGTHSYPVLAGLNNQKDPASDDFYHGQTGIEIVDTDRAALSVYPNPVDNLLNVEATEGIAGIAVYSLSGRRVIDMECGNEATVAIECGQLGSGIYMLNVTLSDGSRAIEKIIKK